MSSRRGIRCLASDDSNAAPAALVGNGAKVHTALRTRCVKLTATPLGVQTDAMGLVYAGKRLLDGLVRPISPAAFVGAGRPPETRWVVVCAGDSITHGLVSANYVTRLQDRLGPNGYQFVNAGATGDLAWNLAQRVGAITRCTPDIVTILIGTNDAAAQIGRSWRDSYVTGQHLPRLPTVDWYFENLIGIVRQLRTESATVLLLTIPPLGEDLSSRYNAIVQQVNQRIRDVGRSEGVPVLPLHERLVAALPRGRTPAAFDGTKRLIYRAIAARFLLRRSWDAIAANHGRALLTDDLHLGDTAAGIVADVIEECLVGMAPRWSDRAVQG